MKRAHAMHMTGSEFVWIICRTGLPDPSDDIFHDGMFGEHIFLLVLDNSHSDTGLS